MALRSLLYAPGNEPRKVNKVGTLGADGVILDLEDAVPVGEKIATREAVRQAIPSVKATAGRVYVRINPTGQKADFSMDFGIADIEAVVRAELDGIVVPKVESAEELAEVDRVLSAQERKAGLPQGTLEITPIIETALGLWNAFEIARSSKRIGSLHFGAGDFTRDVGMEWSRDETELVYARSRLVMISRAAAIEPPTDSVWVLLDDEEGLAASVRRAKSLGFQGKSCIHPKQVETINRGFSYVSPEEVARARKIVDAFTEAEARQSASILVDGEFVDYPLVERARQVLQLHTEMQGQKG
ncbi:MAG: CoA ester lyase [Dehalococcoidia bacterium]|nr:CoA ester lyase [Dehalococcoidia bacterium]